MKSLPSFALKRSRIFGFCLRPVAVALVVGFALTAAVAHAGTLTITGSLDANFADPTGTGTFTSQSTPTNGLDIRYFVGSYPSFDYLSVVNFNLANLPAGAIVTDVTFNFQAGSITSNTGRTVGLFGYAGSSTLSLSDATAAATELTSYDDYLLGLGTHSLDLGAAGASLLSSLGGAYLDIRIQGTTYSTNTGISSIEEAASLPQYDVAPSITVNFTLVPEPSSFILASSGALIAVGCFRRGRGVRL